MNRGNNDLAGSDLINNILIKRLVKAISPGSRTSIKALYLDPFGRLRGQGISLSLSLDSTSCRVIGIHVLQSLNAMPSSDCSDEARKNENDMGFF